MGWPAQRSSPPAPHYWSLHIGPVMWTSTLLDEFGYVPASQVGAELLFDVIGTSYERTSVIVTTNLPFERWTEVLGSDRLVAATLDRLTHRCHLLEATGESYRLKEARRRQAGKRQEGGATEGT